VPTPRLARMTFRLPSFLRRIAARTPTAQEPREPSGRRPGQTSYAPEQNGRPDPGEVVWAWVPFEEDASRGKDRPVLVLAVSDGRVTALPLTSKDHDRDASQERRDGRIWMDVGTGGWDRQGRPSEVRLNRVLSLGVEDVRREGAALDRTVFDAVVAAADPYLR